MLTHWQLAPFALPSLLSALVCMGLLPYVWRRRPAPGTAPFVALLLCLAFWAASHAITVSLTDLPSPLSRNGVPQGEVLVLHDTTARKQTEEALLRAKEELQRANEQLALLANTDALTALSNRRLFLHRLGEEAARARRHHQPLALLMLDLDFFKRINDTFGHSVGDQVLVVAAGAINSVKRETDIAGRIGGEEFGLILPATDLEGARVMAERLRSSIGTQRHLTDDGLEFAVTASLGVASFASGVRDERELLSLADAALYYAKELGRDRVCVAGGPAATA